MAYLENGDLILEDVLLAIEEGPEGLIFVAPPGLTHEDLADLLLDALYEVTCREAEVRRTGLELLRGGVE